MKKILLAFSLILFFSCENENESTPTEIAFTEIGKGFLTGSGSEGIIKSSKIIYTQSDWENLVTQMNSSSIVSSSFTETYIEFDFYTVVAVFDQVRQTSNFSIEISRILETSDNLSISYFIEESSDGVPKTAQPFYLVKIPKTNKALE